jgi:sacsin
LPLPVETDLPVHIDGSFDLDSSRHSLTNDNQGLTGAGKVRAQWNNLLVEHVVSRAYAELILASAGEGVGLTPQEYYRLWPEWHEAKH